MKNCKSILNEIYRGTILSEESKDHLGDCGGCREAYREVREVEDILLSAKPVQPPLNLKASILNQICEQERKLSFPAFRLAIRAALIIIIAGLGYWLGLQTANGGNNGGGNDIDVTQTQAFLLNSEPVSSDSLSQIYFKVLVEENDEN